jgi:hypothetical protein
MKSYKKLSIALLVTLFLSVVGLSVWAAPVRQGTVPNPPNINPIPVTGGTYEITMNCAEKGKVTRVKYLTPIEKEFGKAPDPLTYLTDAAKIELEGTCEVKICYPYPKAYEDKNGQIYKWVVTDTSKTWELVTSVISGDPKQICAIEKLEKGGIYDLIGNK